MKNYKFELSPTQITNLQNKGLKYPNGKLVFPKEGKYIYFSKIPYTEWMNYIAQYLFNRSVEV